MITVQKVLACMEKFAPYALAESWDNCGLLAGDPQHPVTRVLCALDVTEAVVQEAIDTQAQVIVAHHPLIFTSVSRITTEQPVGRILRRVIANDIAVICMHTNADCAQGGVNDALAQALKLQNIINMEAGENGALGRVGDLPYAMTQRDFAQYVKMQLCAGGVRFAQGNREVRRVAVSGGACGKMMDFAIGKGADAFVIGDCSYDIMQRAEALGLTLVDAGHFPTENPVIPVIADYISGNIPEISAVCSQVHKDCIHFI